ncbi:MAG: DUF2505 domain-containing protein [Candidatus Nanopelagicales bacterium]
MGTRLRFVQIYAAGPSAVRAMVTDAEYITARAHVTGALEVTQSTTTSADGVTVLEITRILPSEMPSFAVAIVGQTLTVTEHQEWQPLDADRCTCEFHVGFSAPLTFTGTASMTFDGSQTAVLTEGEFKASIPLLGAKVERLALEQTERYLGKEQAFGAQWLQQGGQAL